MSARVVERNARRERDTRPVDEALVSAVERASKGLVEVELKHLATKDIADEVDQQDERVLQHRVPLLELGGVL